MNKMNNRKEVKRNKDKQIWKTMQMISDLLQEQGLKDVEYTLSTNDEGIVITVNDFIDLNEEE